MTAFGDLIQSKASTFDAAGTLTKTVVMDSAITAGNLVVVNFCYDPTTTVTCSDGTNNFTQFISNLTDNGEFQGAFYLVHPGTILAPTITLTFNGLRNFTGMIAREFLGPFNADTVLDGTPVAFGQSGTTATDNITSGNYTPAVDGCLLLGFTQDTSGDSGSHTAGTGWANLVADLSGGGFFAGESLVQTAKTAKAATFTISVAQSHLTSCIGFRPPYGATQVSEAFGLDDNSESTYTLGTQDADISIATALTRIIRAQVKYTGIYSDWAPTLYYQNDDTGSYIPVPVGSSVAEAYGTVSFVAIGTGNSGSTSVAPGYPAGIAAGQYLVCVVSSGATGNATPDTPSDWTSLGTATTTDGSYGVDTGPRRVTCFGKIADGTETGTLTVTITSGDSCRGTISSFSKAGSGAWVVDAVAANDSGAHTGISMTGAALTWNTGDATLMAVSQRVDNATQSSQSLTASGVTFGARTNRATTAVTTGNDHRHVVDTFAAISATSAVSAAPTWAYTASAAASAAGLFVRLREYTAPVTNLVYVTPSSNVTAGGEATTARMTAPSGMTTGDFVTGRIWDNENGTDTLTPTIGKYSEVAWVVRNDRTSGFTRFRVRDGAKAFGTYTSTPKWTISTGTTVNAGLEALSVTPFAAVVSSDRAIAAALESLSVATFGGIVSSNRAIAAQLESVAVTAFQAALARTISAALESISVSTFAANIASDRAIAAALETITVTTYTAAFSQIISAALEALQVTTFGAVVASDRQVSAALEIIAVVTFAGIVTNDADIAASLETVQVSALAAVISSDRAIAAALESLAVTTYPATFARAVSAALETIAVTTYAASAILENIIAAALEQIAVETFPGTINASADTNISAHLEQISVMALAAAIHSDRAISAALEVLAVTAFPAALSRAISANTEQISVQAFVAALALDRTVAAAIESILVTAYAGSVQIGSELHAALEMLQIATFPAALIIDKTIQAQLESIAVHTLQAFITSPVRPILDVGLQYTIAGQRLEFTFEGVLIDFSFDPSRIDFTLEE